MIAFGLALLSVTALVMLSRLEGSLPTAADPAESEEPEPPGIAGSTLRYEVLRVAAALSSGFAGASLAALTFDIFERKLVLVPAALLLAVLVAAIVGTAQSDSSRSGRRTSWGAFSPHVRILAPLNGLVHAVTRFGARIVTLRGLRGEDRDGEEASEQFSRLVSSEVEMSKDEEKLLRGAISLPHTSVHDVMVPRVAIVGIDVNSPWSEVLDRVRSAQHSRFPVFRDSLDDIVGILVAKDLLPFSLAGKPPASGWQRLVRPAGFVPSSKGTDEQLRDFRQSRTHMAIVADEYGGTAGLLTLEDVLEEVVGEIRDEHDVEEAPIRMEDGTRFWVLGRVPISDLEAVIGEELVSKLATTVGGLVFERLGRVPRLGEELFWGSYRVVVERMKRHAVDRVYFERVDSGDAPQ